MNNQKELTEYEKQRKKAFRYLRKGLIFLAICLGIGKFAVFFSIPFHDLISESAAIAGWVALWRPMELFLYELPELKEEEQQKIQEEKSRKQR